MIAVSETKGYWTLQGQVMAPNTASRNLLTSNGFREVGCRERYGHIDGAWNDVFLYERRSQKAGGPNLPTVSCG